MTKLKRIAIKRFCFDSAANATTPGGFWKRMKSLLPYTGQGTSQQDIQLLENGKVVMEPSNFFNAFFSTPVLDQSVLALTEDDCRAHPSVTSILSNEFNLNFSFCPVSSSYIETQCSVKSNATNRVDLTT